MCSRLLELASRRKLPARSAAQRLGSTIHCSQRRLPLEFMDGSSYTTVISLAEPLARRRG